MSGDEYQTFDEQRDKVLQWQQTNQAALEALAAQGVQLDPKLVTDIRLSALTDVLLGSFDDGMVAERVGHPRLHLELLVQERIAAVLAEVNSKVAAAKLTAGVAQAQARLNGRGGLIIPSSN